VPIFLIWIYLSWVVILLGASFAASLDTFQDRPRNGEFQGAHDFVLLFRVTGHLWEAQIQGNSVTLADLARAEAGTRDERIARILDRLQAAQLARGDEAGHWVLTRDLDAVTLLDLYRVGGFPLPLAEDCPERPDAWTKALFDSLAELDVPAERHLGRPLKNLYKGTS